MPTPREIADRFMQNLVKLPLDEVQARAKAAKIPLADGKGVQKSAARLASDLAAIEYGWVGTKLDKEMGKGSVSSPASKPKSKPLSGGDA